MKTLTLIILFASLAVFADDSVDGGDVEPKKPLTCYCEADIKDFDGELVITKKSIECPKYEKASDLSCTGDFWGPLMDAECRNTETGEYFSDSATFEGNPVAPKPSCSAY